MQVVVGLGVTGLSVVRYLKKLNQSVAVIDTREVPPGLAALQNEFPEIPCYLGGLNRTVLCDATEIIVSPGIACAEPDIVAAQQAGVSIIGDIELFARAARAPILLISGTNGKSTVTTLIGDLARAAGVNVAVGGNLGEPALNLLDENKDLYVLEVSSFQLETTKTLAPTVAVLLNITPDHNDRYAQAVDYIAAKQKVFQQAQLAVYNRADPLTVPQYAVARMQSFGLDAPQGNDLGVNIVGDQAQLVCGSRVLFPLADLASARPNFVNNALAALSVVLHFNWPLESARQVLQHFKGLPHRCELVLEKAGVRWYNDSKATNVGAAIADLEDVAADIPGRQVVIMGGVGKGADFSDLAMPLARYAKQVILLGEAQHEIAQILPADLPRTHVEHLEQAVLCAAQYAQAGDAVVLLPACASFDMFKDYNDRGEQFVRLVYAQG